MKKCRHLRYACNVLPWIGLVDVELTVLRHTITTKVSREGLQ